MASDMPDGGTSDVPSMLYLVRLSPRLLFPPGGEDLARQIALLSGMSEGDEVLVVGCGALGSSLAEMMVRAGVGALTVVDRDYVEPSLHFTYPFFDWVAPPPGDGMHALFWIMAISAAFVSAA